MHSVRLLSLARHVPRKNIQGCIAALAQLHQEGLDFEYHIGGRGPMMASLQAQVIEAGLAEKVKFLGYVADEAVPSLFMEADAFLHPQTNVGEGNDFEGFGLVIADAMSFGCTVLAGDAGGPRDFVRHEVNGLLVDGLNGPELIAEIRRLIIDHELRNRLGQEGRRFALHELDWTKHVRSLIGLAGDSDGGMS